MRRKEEENGIAGIENSPESGVGFESLLPLLTQWKCS
jgi:hypothetical protein